MEIVLEGKIIVFVLGGKFMESLEPPSWPISIGTKMANVRQPMTTRECANRGQD